jgi:hypothetical protein
VESSLVFDELRRAKAPFGELHFFVFSCKQTLNSFRIKWYFFEVIGPLRKDFANCVEPAFPNTFHAKLRAQFPRRQELENRKHARTPPDEFGKTSPTLGFI